MAIHMIEPVENWMKQRGVSRFEAAKILGIPTSTFYDMCKNQNCYVSGSAVFIKYEQISLRNVRR